MPGDLSTMSTDFVNSLIAANAYKKYAKELEKMQLSLPRSVGQAEGIMRSQANTGLPNYEQQKETIDMQMPTTLGQVRDSLSSGQLLGLVGKLNQQELEGQRRLDAAQAGALQGGQQNLATFLSNVKAPMVTNLEQYNNQLKTGAQQARLQAKGAALQGASNVVSTATDTSLISSVLSGLLSKYTNSNINWQGTNRSQQDTQSAEYINPVSSAPGANQENVPAQQVFKNSADQSYQDELSAWQTMLGAMGYLKY